MSGTVFLETSELRIGEANGPVSVAIIRTGDLLGPATIEYGVTPISATLGQDFIGGSGTVTMAAGQSRIVVPVTITDDNLGESTETLTFSIINVDSQTTLLFPRTTQIAILDNENPVVDPPNPPLTSPYTVTEMPIVTGLNQPITFEFARQDPSLIFIAEKGGRIRVFDQDTGNFLPDFVNLSAKVNDIQDRGLLDIALHPDFLNHPYVYAFYVVDPPDTAGRTGNAGPDGGGNRFAYVVRFTADATTGYTTMVPGSEVILVGGAGQTLQDIAGGGAVDSTDTFIQAESGFNAQTGQYIPNYLKVDSRSHAGGSLAFGPDGALYISVGDGASFNMTDPHSLSVQDINSLSGKILRVDPITGLGLPDNPFVQPGDSLSANHSKVYQLGLRNPFSMGFDQDGQLIITNTGWNSWEEIETGGPGANFGWPYYEGGDNGVLVRAPGYDNLSTAAAFYSAVASGQITITPAYRAFSHLSSDPGFQNYCLVGGDVIYTGSMYPAGFQNDFFFTDIADGEVYVVDTNDPSQVRFLYSTGQVPVHFSQGPDGYVYYSGLISGTIGRLLISAPGSPIVTNDSAATSANLPVAINVLANDTDPNGDPLTLIAVSDPPHGTAVINTNGTATNPTDDTITYTPDPGYSGADQFTYTVSDGTSQATASVAINVGLTAHGSTTYDAASDTYTLTTINSQAGTVMSTARMDLRQNFAITLQVYLGTNDSGADGLAFVLHNDPAGVNAIGASGSGMAIEGIHNGLAIEFDTYASSPAELISGPPDIASDHTGFLDTDSAFGTPPVALPNIEDGQFHTVNISWNAATQTLSYTFDGQPVGTLNNANIASAYLGGSDFAYFGVGGGTGGASNEQRVRITSVNATFEGQTPNNGPVAVADAATTSAGTPVNINVLANDTDPNGDPLTITALSDPPHGTAVINTNGTPTNPTDDTITYTPDPGYSGADQFTYTVSDGTNQATASVAINVVPPPGSPIVTNDSAATSANLPVAINVLANDTDPNGDPLTLIAVSDPPHGTAVINTNGTATNPTDDTITYTPDPGYSGADQFTYTVSDGTSQATASVAINVAPQPGTFSLTAHGSTTYDAASDTYTLTTINSQAGTVMSTARMDLRQNFAITLQVYLGTNDSGADGLAFVLHNDPAGVNAIGASGSGMAIEGIHNGLAIEFDTYASSPAELISGPPDIASDHTGFLDTDSAFGTPPVALPNIEDGQFHTVNISWNAATQTLSYTFDGQPVGTLNNANIASAYLGGSDFAYFGVGGGTGGASNEQRVRITSVNATFEGQTPNNGPVAVADAATTSAGTPVNINVLANDTDPNGDPLTITALSDPPHGTAVINTNGTPTNPTDDTITYTPDPGYSGADQFTYTVSDGTNQATASVAINVVPPPGSPIVTNDSAATSANLPVAINVLANDTDPNGDPLTLIAVSDPPHGTAVINTNGTATNPTDDTITYTPDPGYSGADQFTYTVSDGTSQATASVAINVAPQPGTFSLTAHGSTTYDAASDTYTLTTINSQAGTVMSTARMDLRQNFAITLQVYLGTNDSGADGLAFVLHNDPAGVNAIGASGSGMAIEGIHNGLAIEFDTYASSPAELISGPPDIASDHTGFLDTDSAFGTPPVALPNIEDGQFHTVNISWNAATQTLSYTFDGQPVGTLNNANIASAYLGGSDFAYFGVGGGTGGASNEQRVRITSVNATFEGQTPGVNDAPVATPVTLAAGTEDTAYTITAATLLTGVTDVDGPSLSITSVSVASGGGSIVNNGGGTWTYTPAANYSGPVSFNYTASDGALSASSTASLTLAPVNDAPVATPVTLAAGTEDTAYTITAATLLTGITDVDGPSLSITSVSVASGGGSIVNNGGGTWTYTPAANYSGPVSFNYTASDGALSASSTASLTLAPVNDAPVATPVTLAAGTEDTAYTITAATLLTGVTDVDGLSLSITSVSVASGGGSIVNNGGGTWTYTPAANYSGPVSFNYTASDGALSASSTASVIISPVNDVPSISSNGGGPTAAISVAENTTAVTTLTAIDPDVGGMLAYTIVGGADAGKFALNTSTGDLVFVVAPDFEVPGDANSDRVYNVTVQVSDGIATDTQALAIAVTNVDGITVTSNAATITGTGEDDSLTGQGGNNTLLGLAGNDILSGAGGADTLNGGSGNDTLTGGTGNDTLNGDADNDTFRFTLGDGSDTVNGGTGADTLNIIGTTGNDTLDVIFNGTTLTNFEGGTITDIESTTTDLLGGTDTLSYAGTTGAVSANLTTGTASGFFSIAGIENLTGGSGNDNLSGNSQANSLAGGAGADTLIGGAGTDTLNGGAGGDTLIGGLGADSINTGSSNDNIPDFIRFEDVFDFGDTVNNFDATGNTSQTDKVQLAGSLNAAFDDLVANDTFSFVSGNGSNGGNTTANLNTTAEGLFLTGSNSEGVSNGDLGSAISVATEFNAEFDIIANAGQDALLVVNDTNGNNFSVWQYLEDSVTPEIQTNELVLIGIFNANGAVSTGHFELV